MPNRENIHIPNNFSRHEIYNLYKAFVQEAEGNNNFIRYAYFTRLWKIDFNNVCIPKRLRMGVCIICTSLKQRRDRKCYVSKNFLLLNKYQL